MAIKKPAKQRGDRIAVAFRLSPEINQRLNAILRVTRRSLSTELTVALEEHLDRMEAALSRAPANPAQAKKAPASAAADIFA